MISNQPVKYRFYICFLFALLASAAHTAAQNAPRHFRNISVDNGLSQSTVFAMVQDTLGFMWMATQDGLNRYNGSSFNVYRPQKQASNSLQSYYIRSLFLDHSGGLWVGGNQGVSRYNYAGDHFRNYTFRPKPGEWYISAIMEDKDHTVWAATSVGELFRLDATADTFRSVHFEGPALGIRSITCLAASRNGQLFVGTESGLYRLSAAGGKPHAVSLGVANPWVNELYADGDKFWVATEGNGLICYDNRRNTVLHHYLHAPGGASLADNNVRGIGKDVSGNIWLGTFRGLSVLDPETGSFQNYYHQASIPYTISQNSVRCVYRDRQNGIWLGTFYGGANYYHPGDIRFSLLSQNTGAASLNDQVVNVIRQDDKGDFWIGTNDGGLNYWNRKTGTVRYFTHKETSAGGLSANNIKAIIIGADGKMLIGTHNGGLNVFDPGSGNSRVYRHDAANSASIANNMVYALLKDHQNRIWVGTRLGLDQFNPDDHSFTHVYIDRAGKRLSSDEITYLFEDSRKRIWVGTTNGVNQLYPDNLLIDPLPGAALSNDVVNCITEDNKHRIWVGTRNGLNLYDEKARVFVNFNTRQDLLKGVVYGIQPDDEGLLWISTNTGLACFNPDTGSIQYYDNKDGLQNNQFNLYAFCKAADGMLLFGGINGISYFYPAALKQQPLQLNLIFTGLEVFNKAVTPGDGSKVLKRHIDQAERLTFSHDQKQFSISFNTFNYISANRTKYFYQLDGFDNGWQQTAQLPRVTYTNLQPGNYTFRVKAVGPMGENTPVRSLLITVLPPWYKSNWFYLVVALVIAAAAYLVYRFLTERIHTAHQLKMERMQREKVDYINQMKMDFFTNVSHELRTPLTLILAPLEEIINHPPADKQLARHHGLMLMNARRLHHLVEQLFEFKKTELGTRRLKVGRGMLAVFIQDVYGSFIPLAEKNNIRYSFHSTAAVRESYFDRDAMEKVLFNLLSNAFKYTAGGNSIQVIVSEEGDAMVVKVADTGMGIGEEHLDKIFDRFYQVSSKEMNLGSGVGLAFTKSLVELHHGSIAVSSTPGQGSTFTVTVPLGDDHYNNDERETAAAEQPANVAMLPEPEERAAPPDGLMAGHNRETLLIVDDNREIVNYLKDYFSKQYTVQTAYDGNEALALLDELQPALVISDVMMPELDGLHFCKRIKQNIQTSHIPVILLTARTDTAQQIRGLEMGADDYVTKPFSISLVDARVQAILRSRKRLKEYYAASKEIVPENIAFNMLDEAFLRNAIAIVEDNISEYDFSVDKFSREIGMSRSNLYLKLKAITGESVTAFIKRIRFKKAVELMESRQHTMAQVAYMCGFNSPSYFSTAFKQYYDCLPSEYLAKKDAGKH